MALGIAVDPAAQMRSGSSPVRYLHWRTPSRSTDHAALTATLVQFRMSVACP